MCKTSPSNLQEDREKFWNKILDGRRDSFLLSNMNIKYKFRNALNKFHKFPQLISNCLWNHFKGDEKFLNSFCLVSLSIEHTALTLRVPILLFSLSTRSLRQTPFKTTFDLSSWHHLDVGAFRCLFTSALSPHRIIFGNYLRYSNSKRTFPFNGR